MIVNPALKIGCSISNNNQSYQMYEQLEQKHAAGHSSPVKLTFGTILIVFVITAMQLASFAIFGYPLPQQWVLPVETQ